jgi:hypothetical protein
MILKVGDYIYCYKLVGDTKCINTSSNLVSTTMK